MNIDKRKLTRFAKVLRGRRIGVAGDFMLDRYVWGSAMRLSPEAPVPVVDFANESQVLGGAGNVATNLAALGATVFPFGVVGEDNEARAIHSLLKDAGMSTKGVAADASRSTYSTFSMFELAAAIAAATVASTPGRLMTSMRNSAR